jgi:hypothetical protein
MKHHTFCAMALAVTMLAPALLAQQKRPIERADQFSVHRYAPHQGRSLTEGRKDGF